MDMHNVYLGLGANLGDKEQTILRAYRHIERLIGTIRRQSAFYYSEPWGFQSDHSFANTVILVETALKPIEVLHRTQLIERKLGKRREHATERAIGATEHATELAISPTEHATERATDATERPAAPTAHFSLLTSHFSLYHDRPIDIDILLYDDLHLDTPKLKIPHPLMQERDFVMIPLQEIL